MTLAEAQDAKRAADVRWTAALEQLADATEAHRNMDRRGGWLVGPSDLLAAAREVVAADEAVARAQADLVAALNYTQEPTR